MSHTYRFADFELDLDAQQLRKCGQPIHLERRPMDLLVMLVQRHGRMVTRDDIIATLWPPRIIIDFDAGLNTLVRKVRRALGDSPDSPRFIETIAGRGYRFMAPVAEDLTDDRQPVVPGTPHPGRRTVTIAVTVVAVLAGGLALVLGAGLLRDDGQTRIAIMPFENLTGDVQFGYLASGIAEDINTSLGRINLPGLSVIGVVSARASATRSLPEIGRELDADLVVASSLRLEGTRIRVTSRLLRVADSEQVWSESFDRELTNILGLQRELSIAIAEQIRQRLSPSVASAVDARQTQNPEAYALYLKGRYEWMRFQPDSISLAVQFYRQAVAIDPRYALAWAGIAHALITSTVTIESNRREVRDAALDALERALEFGPDLAETQLALASYHVFLVRDLAVAEAASQRSVELDPNSAMCHMFRGVVLSEQGKHVEARDMLRRARELDPLFPLMFANSAVIALTANEPRDAEEFATQAVAINPDFWVGYLHLGGARLALGDYPGAIQAYADAERLSGHNSARATAGRGAALARLGRSEEARQVLDNLMSRPHGHRVPVYHVATLYAELGELEEALAWLERGVATDSIYCTLLENDNIPPLRGDRRLESMISRCYASWASGGTGARWSPSRSKWQNTGSRRQFQPPESRHLVQVASVGTGASGGQVDESRTDVPDADSTGRIAPAHAGDTVPMSDRPD